MIVRKKNGAIDRDWSEICADFALETNAETLRKAGVGVKLVADARMMGEESDDGALDLSDGYMERQKIRD